MNYEHIADNASNAADKLHRTARADARQMNCRVYSRGFEFISLDANEERDEAVIDYCERDEMTPALIERIIAECRQSGSAYLAIGYGVDAAESQRDYDDGDYEPMFDWVDLPNIDVRN